MYIEHPYLYDGKYYALVDGEMVEITKEVAYAMHNFYRNSIPKRMDVRDEKGEVVEKRLREIPFSEALNHDNGFSIEAFPDLSCDVEDSAIDKAEQFEIQKVIERLDTEERMLVYGIYFEDKTQEEMASVMGVSQQIVAYKLKKILNKMRLMCQKKFF